MDINYVEKFRKFIKTNRIRTYHEGVEIFYYQDVQDMLEAMASTPKEPEAVHGNEAEKEVLNDFISAIQTEFADMNWDYLPFIAERVLENRKNGLRRPPLS